LDRFGVCSAGLRITVLPAAIEARTGPRASEMGKFQGEMTRVVPLGTGITLGEAGAQMNPPDTPCGLAHELRPW